MAVYLDDWRQHAHLGSVSDLWSHLIADSDEELHAFADRLGMARVGFQWNERRPHHAHYDVPDRLRADALELGAVPITWRQIGRMMRNRRVGLPGTDTVSMYPLGPIPGGLEKPAGIRECINT